MCPRRTRVELEHGPILLASSAATRHARFLWGDEQLPAHQRFEVVRQRLRERMQRPGRGLTTRGEIGSVEQDGHCPV